MELRGSGAGALPDIRRCAPGTRFAVVCPTTNAVFSCDLQLVEVAKFVLLILHKPFCFSQPLRWDLAANHVLWPFSRKKVCCQNFPLKAPWHTGSTTWSVWFENFSAGFCWEQSLWKWPIQVVSVRHTTGNYEHWKAVSPFLCLVFELLIDILLEKSGKIFGSNVRTLCEYLYVYHATCFACSNSNVPVKVRPCSAWAKNCVKAGYWFIREHRLSKNPANRPFPITSRESALLCLSTCASVTHLSCLTRRLENSRNKLKTRRPPGTGADGELRLWPSGSSCHSLGVKKILWLQLSENSDQIQLFSWVGVFCAASHTASAMERDSSGEDQPREQSSWARCTLLMNRSSYFNDWFTCSPWQYWIFILLQRVNCLWCSLNDCGWPVSTSLSVSSVRCWAAFDLSCYSLDIDHCLIKHVKPDFHRPTVSSLCAELNLYFLEVKFNKFCAQQTMWVFWWMIASDVYLTLCVVGEWGKRIDAGLCMVSLWGVKLSWRCFLHKATRDGPWAIVLQILKDFSNLIFRFVASTDNLLSASFIDVCIIGMPRVLCSDVEKNSKGPLWNSSQNWNYEVQNKHEEATRGGNSFRFVVFLGDCVVCCLWSLFLEMCCDRMDELFLQTQLFSIPSLVEVLRAQQVRWLNCWRGFCIFQRGMSSSTTGRWQSQGSSLAV